MRSSEIEIFFETVWDSLSDGLQKRLLAAVKRSMESGATGGVPEVFIGSLSPEHRIEIEWLIVDESSGKPGVFILAHGGSKGKTRTGIKVNKGMTEFIMRHMDQLEPSSSEG